MRLEPQPARALALLLLAGRRGGDPRGTAGGDLGRAHPRGLRPRPGLLRQPGPHRARRQRREPAVPADAAQARVPLRRAGRHRARREPAPAPPATASGRCAGRAAPAEADSSAGWRGRAAWLRPWPRDGAALSGFAPTRRRARRSSPSRSSTTRPATPRSTASSPDLSDLVVSRLTELAPDRGRRHRQRGGAAPAAGDPQPEGAGRCGAGRLHDHRAAPAPGRRVAVHPPLHPPARRGPPVGAADRPRARGRRRSRPRSRRRRRSAGRRAYLVGPPPS